MGSLLRMRNAGRAQAALFAGFTALIAHSAPESRQAVPSSAASRPARPSAATKARQISSPLTKGCPTGVNAPLKPLSGLSQDTEAPFPCGSSATASAPLARRQSSSPSSGESAEDAFATSVPVALGSSSGTSDSIGKDMLQPPRQTPASAPASSRRASPNRRKVL